ncbi:nucleotidyltransferase domain-containing protein [Pseudomonas aeruginosa]
MDMPDGFIPLPPRVEPQAAFRPLLDDLRRTLARPPFERAVHSIYLYGSVARGEAITGRSDLDLTLVLLRESEINQKGKARKLWDIEEGKGI